MDEKVIYVNYNWLEQFKEYLGSDSRFTSGIKGEIILFSYTGTIKFVFKPNTADPDLIVAVHKTLFSYE